MSGIAIRTLPVGTGAVVALRTAARGGTFDGVVSGLRGEVNQQYLERCRWLDRVTGAVLIFTRDVGHHTSGWFKNPDYERCLHLSTSHVSRRVGATWARQVFGADTVRLAWVEPPATPGGRDMDVWHWRVFCDVHWQAFHPRAEVYSTEFTERGWKSFHELGLDVASPLYPG